ncbi:glycoside hydrolase family 32 protein [Paenibacillus sp. LMG 31458]|uniref:Glycoside hydrolase family 32 protein n=1 Tax=Paenibacillus phytorum TaxID=2654977 RepID=A0ABX1Y712_9BACL|nr:glycoside hydrolase family 32 protein [Paenibacillus phytorum]NOU76707.1 glycoside hydrolase family 32 protein [Paenibacillus phytorum]
MNKYYYQEKYRPQFHFTPETNWMNDPNGLVYYEGEYHLFYQFHPHGSTWGPMHWGHAISKDLVSWEHLPIALFPDHNGYIFSGSAVIDWNDTSGFFNGGSGIVAIFTHADTYPDSDRPRQRQSLAYSADSGRSWTTYEGNPVLTDEGITDFRDPKVFWHEPSGKWIMILAAGNCVRMYFSSNLKEWTFASVFGHEAGSHAGVWECPDLFELPVDEDPDKTKWVMIVSIGNAEEYAEGSRTQYFIGHFDGIQFINENDSATTLWLDHGRDNYAGVTWSDIPKEDGRRVFIGWMSNWKYANQTPTEVWRSAMTIPRVLALRSMPEGTRLVQTPVSDLETLRLEKLEWSDLTLTPNNNILSDISGKKFEMIAKFELDSAAEFGFKVLKSEGQETVIGYDTAAQTLFIDRTRSGAADFCGHFPCKHAAALLPIHNRIKMHIFVDWSSVEVFGNDGILAMTDQIFPDHSSTGLEVYAKEGSVKLVSLMMFPLQPIYSADKSVVMNS